MTTKTDPGSYTACDPPFDTYGATKVPLRTPHGPLTLTVTDAGHVMTEAGYQTSEYQRHGTANYSSGETFNWEGIEVCGSVHFYDAHGWGVRDDNSAYLYSRGGSITPRRKVGIIAYWAEVTRRYMTEHPHIAAHAGLRDAVTALDKKGQDIRELEQQLSQARAARAALRREIRKSLASEYRTGGADSPDHPSPYYNEPVNGYVAELVNSRPFMESIGAVTPPPQNRRTES